MEELNKQIKQRAMTENMSMTIGYVCMLFGVILSTVVAIVFQSKIALAIAIVLFITSMYVRLLIKRNIKRIKKEITEDFSNGK